jgi:hypothetical protein
MIEPRLGFKTFLLTCLLFCSDVDYAFWKRILTGRSVCATVHLRATRGAAVKVIEKLNGTRICSCQASRGIALRFAAFRKRQSKTRLPVPVTVQCKSSNSCKQNTSFDALELLIWFLISNHAFTSYSTLLLSSATIRT